MTETSDLTPMTPERAYELDRRHVFHSWSAQETLQPVVITKAQGTHVWDADGHRMLDFTSQLVYTNLGHQHPRVVQAIKDQADVLCTVAPGYANPARSEAARLIAERTPGDLDRILALAATQREEYARYQPRFWRPAAGAVEAQRAYLLGLIEDAGAVALVSEPSFGYAFGTVRPSPPVYAGGPACLVDDLAVEDPVLWPRVGVELLAAVRSAARDRGATEIVVVTARVDGPKRAALAAAGLVPASEWWVDVLD